MLTTTLAGRGVEQSTGKWSANSKSGGLEEEQEERARRTGGGRDLRASVTHCFSVVGSRIWHLELIDMSPRQPAVVEL
ncbi:hypothetical protein NQZ68_005326 [Dissostichus eleginoides]|nr:hypothetical protein NQZ68_005326 [Dissostichus eleginoides]